MTVKEKIEIILPVIKNFISDDINIEIIDNIVSLSKGDLFLDFSIDEENPQDYIICSAEKGIGFNYKKLF